MFPYVWPGQPGIFARGIKRDNPPKRNRARQRRERYKSMRAPGDGNAPYLHPLTPAEESSDVRVPTIFTEHQKLYGDYSESIEPSPALTLFEHDRQFDPDKRLAHLDRTKLGRVLRSLVCCLPGAREPPPKTGGVRLQPKNDERSSRFCWNFQSEFIHPSAPRPERRLIATSGVRQRIVVPVRVPDP